MISFRNRYCFTLSLASLIAGLFFAFGPVPESLYFNHDAIAHGEIWRLVTAHLVHSDLEHLAWNLCAFLILSLLIEQQSRTMLTLTLLAGTVAVDFYLWINPIGVINYAGLSGVLNTLLVVALYIQFKQNHLSPGLLAVVPIIIYLASLIKIIIELFSQDALFSNTNWLALPEVHGIGFIVGTLLSFFLWLKSFRQICKTTS